MMTPEETEALNQRIIKLVRLGQKNGQHMALANLTALLIQDRDAEVPLSLQRVITHMSTISRNAGDVDDQ